MNLKNPDLFRSWLIRQLEPICKANPEPVSKYVCALLKKEKTEDELRQSLISQLDIFLDSATEEFVTFLSDILREEKYLTDDANFQPTISSKSEPEDCVEFKIDTTDVEATTPDKEKERRKSPSPIQAPTPSPPRKTTTFQKSFSPRPRRTRLHNERRRIVARRSRRDNNSPHSDSPSPIERRQTVRKRSASGSSESSTKSPRRSWIASRPSDAKKHKHSSRHFSRPSPPNIRSRSTSPKLRKRRVANGNFRKRMPPNSRSNSDDERNHNALKRAAAAYANDLSAVDTDLAAAIDQPPPYGQKQRCVDFESKGYCARGDMCPFDHGPSPIVLDNNLLNGIVPMPAPVLGPNFQLQDTVSYTPQFVNASFPMAKPPFRHENHTQLQQHQQQPPQIPHNRELISVPTVGPLPHKSKKLTAGKPSYGHIFSSLPPGVSQTTIELTNVPAELNNIPDLYDNFSTFGSITLIQAKRNNDSSVALLTFSNATEAALAFINADSAMPPTKAAWYADQCIMKPFPRKSIPASGSGGGGQTNTKAAYVINRKVPIATPSQTPNVAISPTVADEAKCKAATTATCTSFAVKVEPNSEKGALNDEKNDKCNAVVTNANEKMRQDPGRLLSDLIKKKRELLEKQLASRKEIIEKMKSLETGSKGEKTWQDMLRKLNDVIVENENSIKISLQQRKEYLQKMNIVPMDSTALNNLKMEKSYQPSSLTSAAASAAASVAANAANAVHAADTVLAETQTGAMSPGNHVQNACQLFGVVSDDQLNENLFDNEDLSAVLDQEMEDDEDEDEEEDDDEDELAQLPDDVESATRCAATTTISSTLNDENVTTSAAVGAAAAALATKCSSVSRNTAAAVSAVAAAADTSGSRNAVPQYTRVVVSGFENGDEDDLLQHFTRFGNILDKEFDNTIPSATLIYDNRKSAENAKKEGRNFQDRLLSVTVYSSNKFPPFSRRTVAATSTMAAAFKQLHQHQHQQQHVHDNDYNSYVPYPGGGNPYKYKNPQMAVTPSIVAAQRHAPSSYRSVYTYRAEQRAARIVSVKMAAENTDTVNLPLQSANKVEEISNAAKSTKELINDDDDDNDNNNDNDNDKDDDEVSASVSQLDSDDDIDDLD